MPANEHWSDILEQGYMKGAAKSPFSMDMPPQSDPWGGPPINPGGGAGHQAGTISPQMASAGANAGGSGSNPIYRGPGMPGQQQNDPYGGVSQGAPVGLDAIKKLMAGDTTSMPVSALSSGGSPLTIPGGSSVGNMAPGYASQVPESAIQGFDPTNLAAAIPNIGMNLAGLGNTTAGRGVNAATNVGMAAAQGGMNPISDISAIASLVKLFGHLF